MAHVQLSVIERLKDDSVKNLRNDHRIPATVYGKKSENFLISCDYQEFRKAYRQAGDATMIILKLNQKSVPVLVQEVQYHPISDQFVHIDFHAIQEDEEVKASVPLKFIGLAPAVKNFSGVLTTPINTVEIRCLPKYLLREIEVDVSSLVDFHSVITINDLSALQNKNIAILTSLDAVIAVVKPPTKEEISVEETSTEDTENKEKKEE